MSVKAGVDSNIRRRYAALATGGNCERVDDRGQLCENRVGGHGR